MSAIPVILFFEKLPFGPLGRLYSLRDVSFDAGSAIENQQFGRLHLKSRRDADDGVQSGICLSSLDLDHRGAADTRLAGQVGLGQLKGAPKFPDLLPEGCSDALLSSRQGLRYRHGFPVNPRLFRAANTPRPKNDDHPCHGAVARAIANCSSSRNRTLPFPKMRSRSRPFRNKIVNGFSEFDAAIFFRVDFSQSRISGPRTAPALSYCLAAQRR